MKKERTLASSGSSETSLSPALRAPRKTRQNHRRRLYCDFDSPVEAVRFGIVIQQNMVGRNASLPEASLDRISDWCQSRRCYHRSSDVYGDGVNIASRLEGIAEPGQVYISSGIYEQVKHKLVCGYESLGDRKVKNITEPVRVYRVLADPAAFNRSRKRRENILIFLLSLTLLVIAVERSGTCSRNRMANYGEAGVSRPVSLGRFRTCPQRRHLARNKLRPCLSLCHRHRLPPRKHRRKLNPLLWSPLSKTTSIATSARVYNTTAPPSESRR